MSCLDRGGNLGVGGRWLKLALGTTSKLCASIARRDHDFACSGLRECVELTKRALGEIGVFGLGAVGFPQSYKTSLHTFVDGNVDGLDHISA